MNKVDIEKEREIFEGYFPSAEGLWIPDKGHGHGGYTGMTDAYWMGWICRATDELHRVPNAGPGGILLTESEAGRVHEWFIAVKDVNPKYLEAADFDLAERIVQFIRLGR